MKIYPAIDIMGGKAVRLRQGLADEVTHYGDPVEIAQRWAHDGADWIHVVDLDGAFEGRIRNTAVLMKIRNLIPFLNIQLGGGIRDIATIEMLLDAGINRVVLGTAAVEDRRLISEAIERYADRIAIGIDARDGRVRISGWTKDSGIDALELARNLAESGAGLVIHTDIAKDGVLEGPNVEATRTLLQNTKLRVIASGGISTLSDVERFASLHDERLEGVIIGKALYEERIRLHEAIRAAVCAAPRVQPFQPRSGGRV
jgi:phosphoribosylformimino-5-aminoimidazole carboxamide ribotide isomerase